MRLRSSRTDPAMSGASFGAARVLVRLGDRVGAAEALARVPATAAAHVTAQVRLCRVLCQDVAGAAPVAADLERASAVLDLVAAQDVAPTTRLGLRRDLLAAALRLCAAGAVDRDLVLGGTPCREGDLRSALERTLRDLATHAATPAARAALVDEANHWRPWTWT